MRVLVAAINFGAIIGLAAAWSESQKTPGMFNWKKTDYL
jgi:hypothetical protein